MTQLSTHQYTLSIKTAAMAYRPPRHPDRKDWSPGKPENDQKSLDKGKGRVTKVPEVTVEEVVSPNTGSTDENSLPSTSPSDPDTHTGGTSLAVEPTARGALSALFAKTPEGKKSLNFMKAAAQQNARMIEKTNFESQRKPHFNSEKPTTTPESMEQAKQRVCFLFYY